MKMKRRLTAFIMILVLLVLSAAGCKKNTVSEDKAQVTAAPEQETLNNPDNDKQTDTDKNAETSDEGAGSSETAADAESDKAEPAPVFSPFAAYRDGSRPRDNMVCAYHVR